MLKTIRQTIREYNMLTPGDGVVVGLSGGADSVALLSALFSLQEEFQLSLYAAHINHNLRGDAAKHDENFVRQLCEDLGVPLQVFSADVQGHAASQKQSIEEAGRNLRYKYLHQVLADFNVQKIAVGHHADDNAETILLNLFRGAGLRGLCGIPPVNGPIIRPLLEVSRKTIEIYAAENNLQFITDETNASGDYTRNYIRNEIIPIIHKHFGDHTTETMTRNAKWLRADEEYMSAMAEKILHGFSPSNPRRDVGIAPYETSEVTLPIDELLSQPTALTTRIIREAIRNLRCEQALEDIQSTHVRAILDITQGQSGREADLPGFKARREYEKLILYIIEQSGQFANPTGPILGPVENQSPAHPQTTTSGFCYPLSPNTPIHVPPLTITLTLHPPKNHEKSQYCCTQAFNYDKVTTVLELRTRRPGDKITFAGGTKKLQDYFTDTKTPRSRRDQIPLLADGSNILWIMDKHNRTNTAYLPVEGQRTCWVCIQRKD